MKINKAAALVARKGFTLVELLVVIAIIAALAGLSYGPIMKQLNAADRTEAISNARSINTALLGFYAANNQQYPNESTDRSDNGTETANELFQQLFDNAIVDDKKFFWNATNARVFDSIDVTEPDNSNATLEREENVWHYIMNLDAGDGSSAIFYDSYTGEDFTAETWDGKAIVAYVDGSVEAEQIQFSGLVEEDGVFQTGPVTVDNTDDGDEINDEDGVLPSGAEVIDQ